MSMSSWRKRCGRLVAGLIGLAALWACNAPFIPVPPPGVTFTSMLAPDGMGGEKTVWITQGGPNEKAASAKFFIFNDDASIGVITRANPDGAFIAPPLDGTQGNHIHIFYEDIKGSRSGTTCRLLMEGPDLAPICPGWGP
jgi:hypothetical protein